MLNCLKKYTILSLIVFAGVALIGCGSRRPPVENIPFHLFNPDRIMTLDEGLHEISGLSMYGDVLVAIQDEIGILYFIDPGKRGKKYQEMRFAGKGDFEAVEVIDDVVYVLESDATLYRIGIDSSLSKTYGVTKFDLPYRRKENFEGMCYDPAREQLLMSAKESPGHEKKNLYPILLDDMISRQEEILTFEAETLKKFMKDQTGEGSQDIGFALSGESYSFNPSGLAIDPITGNLYVLSSPVQQLLVLDKDKRMIAGLFLDPTLFRQPEGICFDGLGNLYISNEGKSGHANIMHFNRIRQE